MRFIGFLAILGVFVAATAQAGPSHGKVVACYGWTSQLLPYMGTNVRGDVVAFEDADLNLCTHIHPFLRAREPWNFTSVMSDEDEEEYKQLIRLKLKYPHLKIMMMIEFRYIAQYYGNSVQYQACIKNIINFLLRFDFDGLDIIKQENYDFKGQTARHVTTVKDLRKSFQHFNLLLTVTWGIKEGDHNYIALSEYIDYMPVISSTAVYSSTEEAISDLHITNMEKRINEIISRGFPSSKVVMNLYFYGYPIHRFGSDSFSGGQPYNQLCNSNLNDKTSGWERHYHTGANLVTLQAKNENSEIRGVIFHNTRSMANLARLAIKFGLAGVAVVSINFDDFRGKCGIEEDTFDDFKPTTKFSMDILKRKFPLLRTINEAITVSLDEIGKEPKPISNPSGCHPFSNFFCNFLHFC
ncbi:probable chitinase 2 isoform X2 [Sitodiplosis mosellana]|uniref:probable chitinase 2 isoform X2 n=1 Tax=Sitodiplosis mosellana TaxID=263140 RepID=UPI00244374B7|nr:probable chitinase 2 isoform X2 [Sitodiplosis mosellana]